MLHHYQVTFIILAFTGLFKATSPLFLTARSTSEDHFINSDASDPRKAPSFSGDFQLEQKHTEFNRKWKRKRNYLILF